MTALPADVLELPGAAAAPLPPRSMDHPVIYVAAQGALRVQGRSRRCVVPVGHLACVAPGVRHVVSAVVPVRAVCLRLPLEQTRSLLQHMGVEPQVHAAPPVLLELVKDAATWSGEPPDPLVVRSWLTAFCGLMPRWCSPPLELDLPVGESPELRSGLASLLGRLDQPVGLADAAEVAEVSPRTIQRRCTVELGLSLSGWLTRARVLLALELLTRSELSIGHIANEAGYQSAAAFTRAFTQHLGSTPSAWRATH